MVEEILKVMRYWLDMGVDALRVDAIPYLVEREGTSCENLPETHAIIKTLRKEIDAHYANRMLLAEANQWPTDVRPYFGDGDECHMAFHFPLMPRIYMALRQEDRLPITDIIAQTPSIPDTCQWALFLRNHDELTLEMVTNDERDYMYLAYSADPRMRLNLGIRRRLAPLVDNNRRRIELLISLLFSFPGTPILYYGDEIGMGDNIYLGDRNGVRTPMQWNGDRNAGFSTATPARLYSPVIMDPVWGYEAVNVEAQQSDPSSLLNWMRNMIALRKLFRVFGRGSIRISRTFQSQSSGLSPKARKRDSAVCRKSLPFRAAGRPGSVGIGRNDSGRDAWATWNFPRSVGAIPLDARSLRILVARASSQAGNRQRHVTSIEEQSPLAFRRLIGKVSSKARHFTSSRPHTCAISSKAALVCREVPPGEIRSGSGLGRAGTFQFGADSRGSAVRALGPPDTYLLPLGVDGGRSSGRTAPHCAERRDCVGRVARGVPGLIHDAVFERRQRVRICFR